MSALAAALLCAAFAGGVCLLIDGARLRPPTPLRPVTRTRTRPPLRRAAYAAAGALVVGLVARWPVAAVAAGVLGWFAPHLLWSSASRATQTERTEAIASWTEMLRDTMAGARGLEEAITTSARVAPAAIADEVSALAAALEHQSLSSALRRFSSDLAHPTGDLVVASLTMAAEGAVGDLGELLGTLAVAAREEAGMRLRIEAARARLRTAVRVIAGCTAITAIGLIALNRPYLRPYSTPTGQAVLALVCSLWGLGLWWLARMGEFISPERFLADPQQEALAQGVAE